MSNLPEANTASRDYDDISPSAKSILLLKGITDIPFARETAGLIVAPDKYVPDLENKDNAFWKRVIHFEQRYWSIDRALSGISIPSIVEISSGFSFRGLETVRQSDVHYIDTDLPALIAQKIPLLQAHIAGINVLQGKLETLPLNVLDETQFNEIVDRLAEGPVVILNEGLLMYLDNSEKEKLCSTIHKLLLKRGGYWITGDVYIKSEMERLNNQSEDSLKDLVQDQRIENNMFESFDAAEAFFKKAGFVIEGESNIEFSKISSLKYLLGNATVPQLQELQPSHKIRTTWRLKAQEH